jgi:hypothetical protein
MAAAAVAQHADDGGSPSPSPEHARLLRAFESVWEIWEAGTSAAKAKAKAKEKAKEKAAVVVIAVVATATATAAAAAAAGGSKLQQVAAS